MTIKARIDLSTSCPVSFHGNNSVCYIVVTCNPVVHLIFLFLVDEFNRIKLSFIRAAEGSDYINASYVDISLTIVCVTCTYFLHMLIPLINSCNSILKVTFSKSFRVG